MENKLMSNIASIGLFLAITFFSYVLYLESESIISNTKMFGLLIFYFIMGVFMLLLSIYHIYNKYISRTIQSYQVEKGKSKILNNIKKFIPTKITQLKENKIGIIKGKACSYEYVNDPITKEKVLYYRVEIVSPCSIGETKYNQPISTIESKNSFYVYDDTGKVNVNLNGADLYIESKFYDNEFSYMSDEIRKNIQKLIDSSEKNFKEFLDDPSHFQLKVSTIKPEQEIYIAGKCNYIDKPGEDYRTIEQIPSFDNKSYLVLYDDIKNIKSLLTSSYYEKTKLVMSFGFGIAGVAVGLFTFVYGLVVSF